MDLVVLSPGLTSGACEALLGTLRSAPQSSTANPLIRVIALCTPMREAPLDGEAVRSVPWPIPFEGLEGDRGYAGGVPPTWLHLDRSDPDVLTLLLTATDSMVSCFSSRGATQQSVERETREDYRERSQPLGRSR